MNRKNRKKFFTSVEAIQKELDFRKMNNRKLAQIQRYTPAVPGFFHAGQDTPGHVRYCCEVCENHSVFKTSALRYAVANGKTLKCDNCTPKVYTPEGFRLVDYNTEGCITLECTDCDRIYHREQNNKYFCCYCKLKTKQGDKFVFDFLRKWGAEEDCKISREEKIPGSNHKADVKIKIGERSLFIEVDGGSHRSREQKELDAEQEDIFSENREPNDYLIRIPEEKLNDDYLEYILSPLLFGGIAEDEEIFRF